MKKEGSTRGIGWNSGKLFEKKVPSSKGRPIYHFYTTTSTDRDGPGLVRRNQPHRGKGPNPDPGV